jgi:flagellar hook-basal body complex protein FliE
MDYSSAISNVIPGTFVPDMGKSVIDERPNVGPIPDGAVAAPGAAPAADQPSFKDTVKAMLDGVNDKINASDQATRDLADGKTNDLQKVVTSVEEANLALNFTLAMRSKLLESYQQISQMQV